ncbi:ABC transporter ATP-binding protein [Nitrogeniibacter mangrovi]|uniref:ABC transporter ATP-binding protein n=1 Tax=Nitrogeniibacter mangrovi TaxID=2016596 RepID=A0A6C1AXW4_9RHOO|nr:ABC transporter ATP-binding protein [Nitrogeniibacter mangrovi]QID16177.1 ABC transporter ATP-binding protein [Nitrogeniibacter mangrovi]
MSTDTLGMATGGQAIAVPAPADMADRGLRAWITSCLRPEYPALILILFLSVVAVLAGLAQPYLTKALIDGGILAGDRDTIVLVGAGMVGLSLASLGVGLACRRVHVAVSARVLHRLREDLFAHVLTLPPAFFSRIRQGDLLTRLEGDLGEVQRFAVDALLSAVSAVLTLIGTVIVLSTLSVKLALFLGGLIALNSLALAWVRPRIEVLSRRVRDAGVDMSSFLVERVGKVRCVQTHLAETRELTQLQGLHQVLRRRMIDAQLFGYLGGAIPNLVLSLAVIGIFVFGALAMLGGEALTLGTLVAFATYVQRASAPVHSLMGIYMQWQRVKVGLARVDALRAVAATAPGGGDAFRPGDIVIRGLTHAYPDAAAPVLDGVDCRIARGAKVWLRGPSGCGKSTLIDLLHRQLACQSGEITIGGRAIDTIELAALRAQVVVVSQQTELFACSLLDNIRYGRPSAGAADVQAVVEASGVGRFAARLPQGLDTVVGTSGTTLSGGERQRVALARALLMAPAVLIVDEGTSSFDEALELDALRAIDALLPTATRIIVSHRPLDPEAFDQVIDIDRSAA